VVVSIFLGFTSDKKPPQIVEMNGNDTFLDVNNAHLRVTSGNVYASAFNLDQIDIVMSSNTASTVNFNNPTKAFNAASNIEVGTANLFVDTTTTRVGVGTASPATTLDVAGDLNVSGNLTIIGTRTTLDTEHLMVKDPIIELGKGNTASPVVDLGLILTRPAGSSNVGIIFDESESTLEIGYTQGNASDSTITMQSAATEPLSVNVNGSLSAAKDQDVTSYLGRAAIGYNGTQSDQATFAHVDHNSDSNFAIRQTNAGKTILNSAAGERINFNINNSTKASVESNGDFKVDTDTLYVDSVNDRVGIGTSSPLETLDVYGGFLVRPERTNKSYFNVWFGSTSSQIENYNPIFGPTRTASYSKNAIYTTTGGLKVSPPNTDFEYFYETIRYYNSFEQIYVHYPSSRSTESPYLSGDVFSSTRFKADNTEDFTGFAIGQDYEAGNSLSDYSHPLDIAKAHSAHMYFKTASLDGSLTEKMRITNTGNVGIGTTNPESILHVQHTTTNNAFIKAVRHNETSSTKPIFAVSEYQMTGETSPGTIIGNHNRSIHIGPIFEAGNTVSSTDIRGIHIRSTGDVGIGTTNPSTELQIGNTSTKTSDTYLTIASDGGSAYAQGIRLIHHGTDDSNMYGWRIRGDDTDGCFHINYINGGSHQTSALTIKNNGIVTTPSRPAFYAWDNSTSRSGTTLTFNSTTYNIGSHYNTSTSRFKTPVAGTYIFAAVLAHDTANEFGDAYFSFYVDGVLRRDILEGMPIHDGHYETHAVYIVNLSANQYVDIRARSGTNITFINGNHGAYYRNCFQGALLG
jgi:hypothetical protein